MNNSNLNNYEQFSINEFLKTAKPKDSLIEELNATVLDARIINNKTKYSLGDNL